MFKKILIAVALVAASFGASALQETPIALTNRVASTVNSSDMYMRDVGRGATDAGITISNKVTSITGTVTMTFKLQGKTAGGEYYDVPGAAISAATPVVGTPNVLTVRPGITVSAGATIAQPLPPVFRVSATTGGSGSATYSMGVSRLN